MASHIGTDDDRAPAIDQLAELQERVGRVERRASEVRAELLALSRQQVDKDEVVQALSTFDPVWDTLTSREKTRVLNLLIERIDYHGGSGEMAITFRPSGIKTLNETIDNEESSE
jgi:site-specific DNA recombinase